MSASYPAIGPSLAAVLLWLELPLNLRSSILNDCGPVWFSLQSEAAIHADKKLHWFIYARYFPPHTGPIGNQTDRVPIPVCPIALLEASGLFDSWEISRQSGIPVLYKLETWVATSGEPDEVEYCDCIARSDLLEAVLLTISDLVRPTFGSDAS